MAAEALVRELTVDLQRARGRQVLYLEGETDIDPFFALCGVPSPIDGLRGDVLVKALTGVKEVRRRIELAEKTQGLRGHFAGIIDGDGRPLADLRREFVGPWAGPLFSWPAYNIESLMVRTAWPAAWGSQPAWHEELPLYSGFVALAGLHRYLQQALESVRLARLERPGVDRIETADEIAEALERDRHLLLGGDELVTRFRREAEVFVAMARPDYTEALAALDGKWLFRRESWRRKIAAEECRRQWTEAVREAGGLGEVKDLWWRITERQSIRR